MKEVTHPQFLYQIAFEERSQDLFEVALKSHTVLRECDGLLAEVWDIPCIARVMVWISYPGGGSKVSQQAGWNDF